MVEANSIEEAMEAHSPLRLALGQTLPKIGYVFFHCEEDKAVNKQKHSDRLVALLQEYANVEYYAVPERGHCDLTTQMRRLYEGKIVDALG